jgi:penicillin amidase
MTLSQSSRRILRLLTAAAAVLVLFLLATAAILRHDMHASLPQNLGLLNGTLPVHGLTASVTITRDTRGVPSIHASNLDDLLFTQGYITASDRLFQMDSLRRHGAGTLAEILGPSLVPHDRLQRILQLRAAADRATAVLAPDQLHQLQAYANGVNAFIATHRSTLPIEFHILHYTPAAWQPRDSLLIALVMSQDLATYFPTKLNREALAAHLPANLLADMYPVGSWRDHPPTQTSNDLTYPTTPVEQIPLDRTQSSVSPADLLRVSGELAHQHCDGCRDGSNNWVVAGSHTATGAPLLSNDMHLGLTAPDIWYEAGLHAEGPTPLNVTGFTLPGVPFVIVGRNPFVSWGFTNSGADVQDVLIEHLRGSGENTQFELPDHTWAPVSHHPECIRVRFGRDITLDVLTVSRSIGSTSIPAPIISPLYPSERRALALAWPIYDPSTVTSPMYAINMATDAASLVAAFAGFGSVSQNLVYADAHHIGYHLLGRIPIRGPATQRPRSTTPYVLPDTTPTEDQDDESGSPQAALYSSGHPDLTLAAFNRTTHPRHHRAAVLGGTQHSRRTPLHTSQPSPSAQDIPAAPTTPYTIGSPLSPVPVDALDPTQIWSGYIPYSALPSVLDPTSGIIATANSRITPDDYPYFITNDWVDAYRVERIDHLLNREIANGNRLTPADMLAIQTDTHSAFDLLLAQRLAYALDHSALTRKDPRLLQAANILRSWDGNVSVNSAAAAIVASTRAELWPMLLIPQMQKPNAIHNPSAPKLSPSAQDDILNLYTWDEKTSALELILQHTPARWLPSAFPSWDDFLTTAVARGLRFDHAPANLSTWTYGSIHPLDIPHPVFGSHSPISTLLGVATGTGDHPNSGDNTTIKQTGLHFGPSERFTADLSNPDNTHANITTGESGNPSSPWFLDQFLAYLNGSTYTLPLTHPNTTHTLTLTPVASGS